jgi:hypothetical protein
MAQKSFRPPQTIEKNYTEFIGRAIGRFWELVENLDFE